MNLGFWEQLKTIVEIAMIVGVLFVTSYYLWKKGNSSSKDEAIKAYKEVIEAYSLKIKEFEDQLTEFRGENKILQAQVNQLVGENKALKNVIVKPDQEYKNTVTTILNEMKTMRSDFIAHSNNDDDRFGNIVDIAKDNNEMLQKLLPVHAWLLAWTQVS